MRKYSLVITLAIVVVLAGGILLSGLLRGPAIQSETLPSGAILSKDDAIQRASYGLEKETEVVDARLLYLDEVRQALNLGIVYESGLYRPDDPVWVIAIKSADVGKLPFFNEGPVQYTGVMHIMNAVDGQAVTMLSIIDPQKDQSLIRLRALPDRTGQIQILPREQPQPVQPELPTPTRIPASSQVESVQ